MTSRLSLFVPISSVAALLLGACAGGPLTAPAPAVTEANYVCDGGGRFTARFEHGQQRILVLGGDLDGREVNAPKNTLVLIPDQGEPVRLTQGPAWTSTGFYYRAAGVDFFGDAGRATLRTAAGTTACRLG